MRKRAQIVPFRCAPLETFSLLGIALAKVTMADAVARVNEWVDRGHRTHMVTFAAAHMLVESNRNAALLDQLRHMDMVCPDGRPLSWVGRIRCGGRVSQVAGPDFMPLFMEQSVARGYKHFLYGGASGVADAAARNLQRSYPGIRIAGTYSPPFRALSPAETDAICRYINASGADLVWVCLGCPKQEEWMMSVRHRLDAKVLLAVGYAIDIVAGVSERAPNCLRHCGLEWLYRLVREPRRLWKRYLTTNSLFLLWTAREFLLGPGKSLGDGAHRPMRIPPRRVANPTSKLQRASGD